jgi:hypothetical protein
MYNDLRTRLYGFCLQCPFELDCNECPFKHIRTLEINKRLSYIDSLEYEALAKLLEDHYDKYIKNVNKNPDEQI